MTVIINFLAQDPIHCDKGAIRSKKPTGYRLTYQTASFLQKAIGGVNPNPEKPEITKSKCQITNKIQCPKLVNFQNYGTDWLSGVSLRKPVIYGVDCVLGVGGE